MPCVCLSFSIWLIGAVCGQTWIAFPKDGDAGMVFPTRTWENRILKGKKEKMRSKVTVDVKAQKHLDIVGLALSAAGRFPHLLSVHNLFREVRVLENLETLQSKYAPEGTKEP